MKLILLLLFSLHVAGEEIVMLDELGPYLNQSLETAECRTHCLEFTVPRTFRACWDTCSLLNSKVQVKKSFFLVYSFCFWNLYSYKVNTIQECKHNKRNSRKRASNRYTLDCSMLDPNRVIAKDILLLCQICNINSTSSGNVLAINNSNSLPCTVRTSKQWSYNHRVGCLLYSMARIYDLLNLSLDICKGRGLSPYYG